MFTGMEGVAQSVLVVHWSVLEALDLELSEASELHRVRGNRWCIFGPLGQEHIVSPFLNEKWTVGGIKLRGVEWGTVEAPDTNSAPRPGPAIAAPSSQRAQLLQLWGKQGRVEVAIQIGHNASETIINKAVSGRSPLKR